MATEREEMEKKKEEKGKEGGGDVTIRIADVLSLASPKAIVSNKLRR